MYEAFFGFSRPPFFMGVDPAGYCWSERNRTIFDAIRTLLLDGESGAVVLGESGVGKTNLLYAIGDDADLGARFRIGLVSNPSGSQAEFCHWILKAFDGFDEGAEARSRSMDAGTLLHALGPGDQPFLLLVDEAQSMSEAGAELLEGLIAPGQQGVRPLQLVCAGLPPLWGRASDEGAVRGPQARFRLEPMSAEDTRDYVRRRIEAAGGEADTLFAPDAIDEIHRRAEGNAYLTNTLCNFCLYSASREGIRCIDRDFARAALAEWLDAGPSAAASVAGAEPSRAAAESGAPPSPKRAAPEAEPSVETASAARSDSAPRSALQQRGGVPWRIAKGFVAGGVLGLFGVNVALMMGEQLLPPRQQPAGNVGSAQADRAFDEDRPEEPALRTDEPAATSQIEAGETARNSLAALSGRAGQTASGDVVLEPSGPETLPAIATLAPLPFDAEAGERLLAEALYLDDAQAAALGYARAAARGSSRGAYYLGQLYETGDGVVYAPQTARAWYDFAARRGHSVPGSGYAGMRAIGGAPMAEAQFSAAEEGAVELVWQGRGPFVVEFGPKPDRPTASYETDLTAVRLVVPFDLGWWRVSPRDGTPGPWLRIGTPAPTLP